MCPKGRQEEGGHAECYSSNRDKLPIMCKNIGKDTKWELVGAQQLEMKEWIEVEIHF